MRLNIPEPGSVLTLTRNWRCKLHLEWHTKRAQRKLLKGYRLLVQVHTGLRGLVRYYGRGRKSETLHHYPIGFIAVPTTTWMPAHKRVSTHMDSKHEWARAVGLYNSKHRELGLDPNPKTGAIPCDDSRLSRASRRILVEYTVPKGDQLVLRKIEATAPNRWDRGTSTVYLAHGSTELRVPLSEFNGICAGVNTDADKTAAAKGYLNIQPGVTRPKVGQWVRRHINGTTVIHRWNGKPDTDPSGASAHNRYGSNRLDTVLSVPLGGGEQPEYHEPILGLWGNTDAFAQQVVSYQFKYIPHLHYGYVAGVKPDWQTYPTYITKAQRKEAAKAEQKK